MLRQLIQKPPNMATLTLLALALLAGVTFASPGSRISGGSPTSVAKYQSIVQVESLGSGSGIWSQTCGGHILTTRYVLSAANCFHGVFYEPRNRRIRAGSSIRSYAGQVRYVDREINHPTYGSNGMDGDITIVRLLKNLEYGLYVQQGTIIAADFHMPEGIPVEIAGWGATEVGGLPSNELREANVLIVDRAVCAQRYSSLPIPSPVTNNMICIGLLDVAGGASCTGDYGGPVYYGNILVGIQSWGQNCGNKTLPGVSTAVSSYTTWVIDSAV